MQPKLNAREAWVRAISREFGIWVTNRVRKYVRCLGMLRGIPANMITGGITIEIEAFLVVTPKDQTLLANLKSLHWN